MPRFNDSHPLEPLDWQVQVTMAEVIDVKRSLGLYLPELLEDKFALLSEIGEDCIMFMDIMLIICKKQIRDRWPGDPDKADREFLTRMSSDGLHNAQIAFLEAMRDFFPSRQQKLILDRAIQEATLAEKKLASLLETELSKIPIGDLGDLSTNNASSSQESPESIPEDSLTPS